MTGWGGTPVVWLPDIEGSGHTSLPERQDPWERGLAVGGMDSPDGWRDKAKWDYYQKHVLMWWQTAGRVPYPKSHYKAPERSIKVAVTGTPDFLSLSPLGRATGGRGTYSRWYVSRWSTDYCRGVIERIDGTNKWFVHDLKERDIAFGTKRKGYATKAEAVAVAAELYANRTDKHVPLPF